MDTKKIEEFKREYKEFAERIEEKGLTNEFMDFMILGAISALIEEISNEAMRQDFEELIERWSDIYREAIE